MDWATNISTKYKIIYHILHRCGFPVFHNTQEQNSPLCKAAKKIMHINQMLAIKAEEIYMNVLQ